MSEVVVDTDVISYIFKNDSRAEKFKTVIRAFDYRFISFQTIAELEKWTIMNNWGLARKAELHYLLEGFEILYADQAVCRLWARIIAEEAVNGRKLKAEDAWVAANAIEISAPLATNNTKDFMRIDGLRLL